VNRVLVTRYNRVNYAVTAYGCAVTAYKLRGNRVNYAVTAYGYAEPRISYAVTAKITRLPRKVIRGDRVQVTFISCADGTRWHLTGSIQVSRGCHLKKELTIEKH
jgi:hypothetical protein